MVTEGYFTQAEAVERLFGIVLAKHTVFKNAVSTLATALNKQGVLPLQKEGNNYAAGSRQRITLPGKALTVLSNAIILQGLFGEPKTVVSLFKDSAARAGHADRARSLLLERQSVANVGLIRHELLQVLDLLGSSVDLTQERLPNPFDNNVFPQMGLSDYGGNLLRALACQTAALSQGDSMMAHYLNGELEQAHKLASKLHTQNTILQKYQRLIVRDYHEAQDFDNLLDDLR
ncbi:hypothetical protein ACKC9G_05560 [Pokkaliibacter sp. CJK22405]|uniref:hypothetical protein n=1 Tax=Pokkaliibacter sp. CJK22405 TaxID=3384615 RepID=UPI00398501E3